MEALFKEGQHVAKPICPCIGMTEPELVEAIHLCRGSLDVLRESTGVATHCTGCLPAVVEILDETLKGPQTHGRIPRGVPLNVRFDMRRWLRRLKRVVIPIRYGIFVIDTPFVKTRVALCNLPVEEDAESAKPLHFWVTMFDQHGKRVRSWTIILHPRESLLWNVGDLLLDSAYKDRPYYGLMRFVTWASRVGPTRPYAFWFNDSGLASTHEKFSVHRTPGWKSTMVFVEVSQTYDTDLIICNPLRKPYRSAVTLFNDQGECLPLGFVAVPGRGTIILCTAELKSECLPFLKGKPGSLMLENETHPVMTYYLGHDKERNRWLIQHL